jgi:hypothetical protein
VGGGARGKSTNWSFLRFHCTERPNRRSLQWSGASTFHIRPRAALALAPPCHAHTSPAAPGTGLPLQRAQDPCHNVRWTIPSGKPADPLIA